MSTSRTTEIRPISMAGEPEWLTSYRQTHAGYASTTGLPDRRVESWKYTPMRLLGDAPLAGVAANIDSTSTVAVPESLLGDEAHRLVFVNGHFVADQSRLLDADGVACGSLAQALQADSSIAALDGNYAAPEEAFAAINSARFLDGAFVSLPDETNIGEPLHIYHVLCNPGYGIHQRNVIALGVGCKLDVVEHTLCLSDTDEGFGSLVTQVTVGGGSQVSLTRLQKLSPRQSWIRRQEVRLDQGAQFDQRSFELGGGVVRNDDLVEFARPDASAALHGYYGVGGTSHIDNRLILDHAAPNCRSDQNYRGILTDKGRAVFNGKVHVRAGADGTDAQQSNRNLLLSLNAEVDTKPELEIYADDVVCSHGATVGQLDETALFYLQSRGISSREASAMLTAGFAAHIVEQVPNKDLREFMRGEVLAQIGRLMEEMS